MVKKVRIQLIKAKTFELDPKKSYLIIIDRRTLTVEDTQSLVRQITRMGIKNLGVMVNGSVDNVKIVEAPQEMTYA